MEVLRRDNTPFVELYLYQSFLFRHLEMVGNTQDASSRRTGFCNLWLTSYETPGMSLLISQASSPLGRISVLLLFGMVVRVTRDNGCVSIFYCCMRNHSIIQNWAQLVLDEVMHVAAFSWQFSWGWDAQNDFIHNSSAQLEFPESLEGLAGPPSLSMWLSSRVARLLQIQDGGSRSCHASSGQGPELSVIYTIFYQSKQVIGPARFKGRRNKIYLLMVETA